VQSPLPRSGNGEDDKPASETPAPPTVSKKRKKSADKSGGIPRRASVQDDDEDNDSSDATPEERRKERQRQKKKSLAQVNIGLLIHVIKLWVFVVLVFFIFLWSVFGITIDTASLPNADPDFGKESIDLFKSTVNVCWKIILFLVILTPVVGVIGSGFCCLTPKKSEARGTIITALVFDFIPLVASIMILLAEFEAFGLEKTKNDTLLFYLSAASLFFSISALFLFVIFLRMLAYYIQKALLASEALNMVSWLMIMVGAAPVASWQ